MDKPSVSIVIPVFNEERYLGFCLDSVSKLEYSADKLETVLVDNGSTDRTLEIARRYDVKIYERLAVKVGAVRNYGVSKARGDLIVFLDSDCVAEPDWILRGLASLNDRFEAVGGLYLLRDRPAWIERYWILKSTRDFLCQTTFVGGCIFIWRSAFESIGGFDEELSAGEDADLTVRLRAAGKEIKMDPGLSVVHLGYPDTVSSFVKRQMWHSEDYYQRFPAVLTDRIFWLTNLFFLGFILLLSALYLGVTTLAVGLPLFLIPPLVLTIKRVVRYQVKGVKLFDLVSVYLVDVLYLTGRVLGSMRSLRNLLLPDGNRKYARR